MGARWLRVGARVLAVASAAVVAGTASGAAQAATEYDGDATALQIEGLQLQLAPGGMESLPPQLRPIGNALKELQSQAPKELQRDSLTIAVPDQTIGTATYPGVGTEGEIPPNPLIAAELIEARSVKTKSGDVHSESSVAGLSVGGGVLNADLIRTSCVGDGKTVTLDVSQLELGSNQDIVKTEVRLKPGSAVPIAGLGTITFNQQETDGSTFGEATNVVIDLDTDLSLAALGRIFDTTAPAVQDALRQILIQLGKTQTGGQQPFSQALNRKTVDQLEGQALYSELDKAVDQVAAGLPDEAKNGLNDLLHLQGTVTIANSACSQDTVGSEPQRDSGEPEVEPVADREPPLADTGSPSGMVGMAVAGLSALAAGAYALTRLRRRGGAA